MEKTLKLELSKNTNEEKTAIEMSKLYYGSNLTALEVASRFNFASNSNITNRSAALIRLFEKYHLRQDKDMSIFHKRFSVNECFFSEINTETKAYILGLICADGNISRPPRNVMSIGLQYRDIQLLEDVKKAMNYEGNVKVYEYKRISCSHKSTKTAVLSITSKKICEDLLSCCVGPCKSLTIEFPKFMTDIGGDILRHFIRGLFDGDGCLRKTIGYKDKSMFEFNVSICGNKIFCEGLLPVLNNISNSNFRLYPTSTIYTVQVGGNRQVLKFMEWLYKDATIYMTRKYKRYLCLKEQTDKITKNQTSQYYGVWKDSRSGKFASSFRYNGKRIHAGWSFLSDIEAAIARDDLIIKTCGKSLLHQLNFPCGIPNIKPFTLWDIL